MQYADYPGTPVYAGFWLRFCSYVVDAVLYLVVITLPTQLIYPATKEIYLGIHLVNATFLPFITIAFLVKYGATPGKMALKLKVKKVDLSPIEMREAVLRESPTMFLIFLGIISATIVTNKLELSTLQDLSSGFFALFGSDAKMEAMKKAGELLKEADPLNRITSTLSFLWLLAEIITLATNEKRRAIHDYMAGTVVLSERHLPKAERT